MAKSKNKTPARATASPRTPASAKAPANLLSGSKRTRSTVRPPSKRPKTATAKRATAFTLPAADLENLTPEQSTRYQQLKKLKTSELRAVCRDLGADFLREGKADNSLVVRRILHFEFSHADDSHLEGFDLEDIEGGDDGHGSTPGETNLIGLPQAALDLLNQRAALVRFFKSKGVKDMHLSLLRATLDFPSEATQRDKFIETARKAVKRHVLRLKKLLAGTHDEWSDSDVEEVKTDTTLPHKCLLCLSAHDGEDPHVCDACMLNTESLTVARARRAKAKLDKQARHAQGGSSSSSDSGIPRATFPDFPDLAAKLLPAGLTRETITGDDYFFYTRIDPLVLEATYERRFCPLMFYGTSDFSESSSKLYPNKAASTIMIDSSSGMVTAAAGLKFTAKPIKAAEQLTSCIMNLHRLELKFRTEQHTILSDFAQVRQWLQHFGVSPTLQAVEKMRQLRMANRTYDRIGLAQPDFSINSALLMSQRPGPHGMGAYNGDRVGDGKYNDRTAKSTGQRRTPNTKEKASPALTKELADAARANGWCIKFQLGKCQEASTHTVKPRDASKAPYTVEHKCAKCEQAGHGATTCTK